MDQFLLGEWSGKTIFKEIESESKLKVAVVKYTDCHELVTSPPPLFIPFLKKTILVWNLEEFLHQECFADLTKKKVVIVFMHGDKAVPRLTT